ncbi:MAG: energy-coupled thiamine transporter ThiT [Clostridia bacterium]|nr:energy-coupled thiamine transporter ThiT [Clostridia bacterium]
MKHTNTHKLVTSAILLALSFVLSFVKIIDFPWGGSVTLFSMLPICLVSLKFGIGWGLGTAFAYSLLQLFQGLGEAMSWGLTVDAWIGMILFDYLIAFTALGLAGILRRGGRGGYVAGTAIAIGLRYVSSVLSGAIVWKSVGEVAFGWSFENTWLYSLVYNGLYMLPELVITITVLLILTALPQLRWLIAPDAQV